MQECGPMALVSMILLVLSKLFWTFCECAIARLAN